jgi:protein-disulfide isomerase
MTAPPRNRPRATRSLRAFLSAHADFAFRLSRRVLPALTLVAGSGALLTTGCSSAAATATGSSPGSAAGSAADDQRPAARIGSRTLTNAELDVKIAGEIKSLQERAAAAEEQVKIQLEDVKRQVREQEYTLRKRALTDMLTEMEAQERKITSAELVAREVGAKIVVTPSEIEALWEDVRANARGATRQQLQPQLEQMVRQRKTESSLATFHRALLKKHGVTLIGLQPIRVELKIPDDAPAIGPKDAPITIVEYTDYQCPFCQRAEAGVQQVIAKYGSQVRLVYRDFPLDFHAQAKSAGVAARCGGEEGKFWEMHRNLLTVPGTFDEADLRRRAASVGLDPAKFSACLASGRFDAAMEEALAEGKRHGVSGTPTFFLNGRVFSGAQPFDFYERMIEEELFLKAAAR